MHESTIGMCVCGYSINTLLYAYIKRGKLREGQTVYNINGKHAQGTRRSNQPSSFRISCDCSKNCIYLYTHLFAPEFSMQCGHTFTYIRGISIFMSPCAADIKIDSNVARHAEVVGMLRIQSEIKHLKHGLYTVCDCMHVCVHVWGSLHEPNCLCGASRALCSSCARRLLHYRDLKPSLAVKLTVERRES